MCDCRKNDGTALLYLKCAGLLSQVRNISDADLSSYVARSGANPKTPNQWGGKRTEEWCYAEACLRIGRIVYWKKTPGDCPQTTTIHLGLVNSLNKAGAIAGVAAGGVATVGSLGSASVIGSAAPSFALSAIPFISAITIPLAIWGSVSAHHKIAVAREQATGCDVAQAFNEYQDTIEAGLTSGKISLTDAKNAIPNVEQQLLAALKPISKECDLGCEMGKAIKCLDLYNTEKWYDSLSPHGLSGLLATGKGGKYATAAAIGVGAAVLA